MTPDNWKPMPNVCIITDSTAQFTQPRFPGDERVHVISFQIKETEHHDDRSLPGGTPELKPLISPSVQEFVRLYSRLSRIYDSILVLTLSSLLDSTMQNAFEASEQCKVGATVLVVDSQTTAIGLGMLVQVAARAASEGATLSEIDRLLRASIPCVYMLLCIPELTCLAQSGYMSNAQAQVAEMMGILPVFTFDDGRLVPMEKVRTSRHLFEVFQDFMGEFESPSQIALIYGSGHTNLRIGPLREFIAETFPQTLFNEYPLQPHAAMLFGPRSIGLVIMEPLE